MKKLSIHDPALCRSAGVFGLDVDRNLVKASACVDWLKSNGVEVERFGLSQQSMAFVENAAVKNVLDADGPDALPVLMLMLMLDGEIVLKGHYPSRDELTWQGSMICDRTTFRHGDGWSRTVIDRVIGTGDGTTTAFRLVRRCASLSQTWARAITKPVAGTVSVALDGAEQLGDWSVGTTTGMVSFDAAPATGVAITASFAFDVPTRCDTDVLDVALENERPGSIAFIPLMEIRR